MNEYQYQSELGELLARWGDELPDSLNPQPIVMVRVQDKPWMVLIDEQGEIITVEVYPPFDYDNEHAQASTYLRGFEVWSHYYASLELCGNVIQQSH